LHTALSGTKAGIDKNGNKAKGKIELDDAVRTHVRRTAAELLNRFVLYPELDLDFLKKHFL
jgi:glycine hydroxymethyltransferase